MDNYEHEIDFETRAKILIGWIRRYNRVNTTEDDLIQHVKDLLVNWHEFDILKTKIKGIRG